MPFIIGSVTALFLPRGLTTSITLPIEMLTAALSILSSQGMGPKIEKHLVGVDGTEVTLTGGITVKVDKLIDEVNRTDLIILPALWRSPKPLLNEYPKLIDWLRYQHQQGATIIASGSGVYLPASAGLLDGFPATTHWFLFKRFARDFPKVKLKSGYLITEANRIYCAGSVNSIADLIVHLIGRAWGANVAHRVEQQFSYEIRRPYETISLSTMGASHQDESIMLLQQWIKSNLTQELDVVTLAQRAQMSQRTLNRRFQAATDLTPSEYIQLLRMQLARELLKDTNLNISAIGAQVGYAESSYFCRLFKKHNQLTPMDFRRNVRGKLFFLS